MGSSGDCDTLTAGEIDAILGGTTVRLMGVD